MMNEFWTKWQLWPINVITQIFQSLYNFISILAATKHKEKTPQNSKIPKKDVESDRPMTQSRREEYMREQNSKLRKMGKLPPSTSSKPESSRYDFT